MHKIDRKGGFRTLAIPTVFSTIISLVYNLTDTYFIGLLDDFCVQNGTAICKELKGTETGKMIRSCPDCVMDAARLAEAILLENAGEAFQNEK